MLFSVAWWSSASRTTTGPCTEPVWGIYTAEPGTEDAGRLALRTQFSVE
ncbi:hypothetical protein ABIA39_008209 [Nocardia sp. GAS34]